MWGLKAQYFIPNQRPSLKQYLIKLSFNIFAFLNKSSNLILNSLNMIDLWQKFGLSFLNFVFIFKSAMRI